MRASKRLSTTLSVFSIFFLAWHLLRLVGFLSYRPLFALYGEPQTLLIITSGLLAAGLAGALPFLFWNMRKAVDATAGLILASSIVYWSELLIFRDISEIAPAPVIASLVPFAYCLFALRSIRKGHPNYFLKEKNKHEQ